MKGKIAISICTLMLVFCFCYSQQLTPRLDTTSVNGWPTIAYGTCIVSNNGLYIGYLVNDAMLYMNNKTKLIYQDIYHKWKVQYDILGSPLFTDDSKYGISLSENGELYIQELGRNKRRVIPNVANFTLIGDIGRQFLVIQESVSERIRIINISEDSEERYEHIKNIIFSNDKTTIAYIENKNDTHYIKIHRPTSHQIVNVWAGKNLPSKLTIDEHGSNLSFFTDSSVWLWRADSKISKAIKLHIPAENYDNIDFIVEGPHSFSQQGQLLFIRMQMLPVPERGQESKQVQVYSYQDASFKIDGLPERSSYLWAYNLITENFKRVESVNEKICGLSTDENRILLSKIEGSSSEYYWNALSQEKTSILDLANSKKITVCSKPGTTKMSPDGNYLIYQQDSGGDLYCLNFKTEKTINLTKQLPIPLIDDVVEDLEHKKSRGLSFYNWTIGGKYAIIYDRFDLWQIDPSGNLPAVNLTNGYGRRHHIVFRFYQQVIYDDVQNRPNESEVITGFNEDTKDNGFFRLKQGEGKDPEVLTMGKYIYIAPGQPVTNIPPVKARDKSIWIVARMSSQESLNYFWTSDFRNFHLISDIHPERNYQWHTSELITFQTKEGNKTQAILYKPENYDPNKKYPVLFNCYDKETAKLNSFLLPKITDGYSFNFPMMLSRGYLICLTDIHFQIGEPVHSIVDALEGAASYISQLPYVDSTRYGICGGSLGGYEANCIAAFSNKFAAVVSISGPSDLISAYGNVPGLRDENYENRQFRMGVSLSSDPEKYLRNSPVAYAKNVKTPILIVNTLRDDNVNVQQGIEWFISLRREGKYAWMLRYQHDDHGISAINDHYDLYTRMNQFFDHYLKSVPAPKWMTQGMNINQVRIDSGFEYDREITTPSASRLIIPVK